MRPCNPDRDAAKLAVTLVVLFLATVAVVVALGACRVPDYIELEVWGSDAAGSAAATGPGNSYDLGIDQTGVALTGGWRTRPVQVELPSPSKAFPDADPRYEDTNPSGDTPGQDPAPGGNAPGPLDDPPAEADLWVKLLSLGVPLVVTVTELMRRKGWLGQGLQDRW